MGIVLTFNNPLPMALPSLTELSDFTARTIRRFTISILAAYVATILSVIANHNSYGTPNNLYPYIMTCLFAFPLALAVDVFMESKKVGGIGRFFSRIVVLGVIGVAYYFVFSSLKEHFSSDSLRSFLMFLSAAVLVFLAPFFCKGKANAFWQFAIAIIVRFFQALVYFGILYLGIILLIESVNYLFKLNLGSEYYGDAWFVITGIFASVYGLAGVPANYKSLDQTTAYPKFLRVLTEYFLVPLVSLYLIVLYAYSAKILFTLTWPLGGVASWIMGFSAVGVLTYFFIYSIKEKFLGYVEFYKKWFFVFLLPLLVVLGLSIGIRIQAYAVTQDRYFVVAFGVWALILAAFYLISRSKNLKFMAASLFVILLITMYGPQSVFELPKTTQMARLQKILIQDGILIDGKVVKINNAKLSQDDGYAIDSIMTYIASSYGVEVFQPWFNQNLSEIKTQYPGDYWNKVQIMESDYMGLDMTKVHGPSGVDGSNYKSFYLQGQTTCTSPLKVKMSPYNAGCAVDVGGYKYYFQLDLYGMVGALNPTFIAGDQQYMASLKDGQILTISNSNTSEVLVAVNLKDLIENLAKKYPNTPEVSSADLTIHFDQGDFRISTINAQYDADKFKNIDNVSGALLLK